MPTDSSNSQAATSGVPGLPSPAGFDETTGQPYWLGPQGQKLYWQQMQQMMWAAQQQRQRTTGKGPESINIPQMPQVYTGQAAESGLERNMERPQERPESKAEAAPEAQAEKPQDSGPAASPTPHTGAANSYLGDSPKLTKLSTGDVKSMSDFVQTNASAPPSSSNKFLAELVKKVLHMLSVSHS